MITQGMCTSFKVGLLNGEFDFGTGTTQTFNIALYTSAANISPATTAYTSANEASGAGYSPGGTPLSISVVPTSTGTTAYLNFSTVTWPVTSITARGALIYLANGTTNPAIAVLEFGEDKTTNSGDFVVQFPATDAATAIIRIA